MEKMRAAVFNRYGPPDVLHIESVDRPSPRPDEVLIRVDASTVNGGEVFGRQGRLRLVTGRRFPQPIGIDFVGKVAAVGSSVSMLNIGDQVWGALDERGGLGSTAEYLVTSPENVSRAPRNLSALSASSLLAGGSTALRALREEASLRPGERLLIRGAAGGVGSVAIQIGKMLGAHVTALSSHASSDFVRSLGADDVIDYRTPSAQLPRYDVIFDTRGTEVRAFRSRLAPGGRMVTIAFDLDAPIRSLGYILLSTLHGRGRVRIFFGKADRRLLAELARAAEDELVRPVLAETYPLDRVADAHARLERGGVNGKIVIDVTSITDASSP
jgi:NADPH:quinone reductase-like Zn-dependent oxidoreductase